MSTKNEPWIIRDLSWLSFNERVLQEAKDNSNHPYERLYFLGIFSNNLDEFFRVRVAALKRMHLLGKAAQMHLEENPQLILDRIQHIVIAQQHDFDHTYAQLIRGLKDNGIFIKNESQLNEPQKRFIQKYFEEKVRTQVVPLMIESIPQIPLLNDKSIYLACVLGSKNNSLTRQFALIEIPTRHLPRFVRLPSQRDTHDIILLEDIIRFNLGHIFAAFNFDMFSGHLIKVTRDAEIDIDNDLNANLIEELQKGLKGRKKGKATRFIYDRNIEPHLLDYLIKRLNLTRRDNLIAGGRIHNFKDFMNFPAEVFRDIKPRSASFSHPDLVQPCRIMDVLERKDVMLHFPYHSFDSIIDLLREAAIDPFVKSIKISCYRLSKHSKVMNALVNAVRNGKKVIAVIELRARFDEEANLAWKTVLEEEGVEVLLGLPDKKIHAKICLIERHGLDKKQSFGFIGTGNFNEDTAGFYCDHCLMTSNKKITAGIRHLFHYIKYPDQKSVSPARYKTLPVAPFNMRSYFMQCIDAEIKAAKNKKPAKMILKINSLVDRQLIQKIYEAAEADVEVNLIVRGICCAQTKRKSFKRPIRAISIIDQYLEHARVFVFHNGGKPKVYLSSADWMVRNLDHRVEAACPVYNAELRQELIDILNIQLSENVKGRILDNNQKNRYIKRDEGDPSVRSQLAIHEYLYQKANAARENVTP